MNNLITINPHIRNGKPTIRGTRLAVADVLSYLQARMSIVEIINDFPTLTRDDVIACLEYAKQHPETFASHTIEAIWQREFG